VTEPSGNGLASILKPPLRGFGGSQKLSEIRPRRTVAWDSPNFDRRMLLHFHGSFLKCGCQGSALLFRGIPFSGRPVALLAVARLASGNKVEGHSQAALGTGLHMVNLASASAAVAAGVAIPAQHSRPQLRGGRAKGCEYRIAGQIRSHLPSQISARTGGPNRGNALTKIFRAKSGTPYVSQ
jgi:hypothetical protein